MKNKKIGTIGMLGASHAGWSVLFWFIVFVIIYHFIEKENEQSISSPLR